MATKLTDRQNFTKYCNSNANYLVSANRNMDYVNTYGQVYICLTKTKNWKQWNYSNIGYHGNQTIRLSVILQKEHIQSKTSPLNKGSNWLFKHILRNQHLIFNIKFKFTNELSQFMLPWQPKYHIISDFTKNGYSTKRAYSMQTTSFQHDKIWIIFNIIYTIYFCYTNTQIIVLKTPD